MKRRRGKRTRSAGRGGRRLALAALGLLFLGPVVAVLPLRWVSVDSTAFMRRAEAGGETVQQTWVPADRLSPWLGIAVVASEDQKFPVHHGFDVDSIRQAMGDGASRGASTLSQQVVKNVYLWPGRSWIRKGLEAWLTVYLELLVPKPRILEIYLNIAQFGAGLYGAEASALTLFGKPAALLSLEESARLAAVLPAPERMNAAQPSPYVRERAAWIQGQVRRLGGPGYAPLSGSPSPVMPVAGPERP